MSIVLAGLLLFAPPVSARQENATSVPAGPYLGQSSPGADAYPFIAPDQSYLLFCSGRPGRKSVETDMYISFKTEDGEWGVPVQAGPGINNGKTVSFPRVTPDGKYLFFRRFIDGHGAFFWVEARILEELRP